MTGAALEQFFFAIFSLLTLGGALLAITRKSAIHSAILLMVSLLGVAGLYLLQHAEFLFAVQIILYIGGILLLFLFVIMLVNLDDAAQLRQFQTQWPLGVAAAAAAAAGIWFLIQRGAASLPAPSIALNPPVGNTEQIADVLFSSYLVPFEAASLLLTVAVVGSVLMAKKKS